MKLLILNESCISLFHCKAIGSFLSFYTYSELRKISLVDVFNFTKPAWSLKSVIMHAVLNSCNHCLSQRTNWNSQVADDTSVQSILYSLQCKQDAHAPGILRFIPWSLKMWFDEIFGITSLFVFWKVYVAVTYQAKQFSTLELGVPFFFISHGISRNVASAINRSYSYRAVGGMGLMTSNS